MAAILWIGSAATAAGLILAAAVVLWPERPRGPRVWEIQQRLDKEKRGWR